VNGKLLVYLEGESDKFIHNAGQIILVRCSNITVMNSELTNTDVGIELWQSDNCLISDNNISSNNDGIWLEDSNNNSVSNNIINSNNRYGILLYFSDNNSILNNSIKSNSWRGIFIHYSNKNSISNNSISSNNWVGIRLGHSNNNSISENIIGSNKYYGIEFDHSNNNIISNNIISSNNWCGIALEYSNENSISNNNISNNGIELWFSNENTIRENEFVNDGLSVYRSYGNIVEDNTVNGKPLVYLEDESDKIIDNAGQVILVKCKNITVMNTEIKNTDVGIKLFESDNCLISNNSITSNKYGISLEHSNNNIVSNNIIKSNEWHGILIGGNNNSIIENDIESNKYGINLCNSNNNSISENIIRSNKYGIRIWFSNENIICLNNFINNTYNADSYNSKNIWNSTEPIKYTYKGSKFTNYMGNYWDDYNGYDENRDGIGETPYIIDGNNIDNYPLIERFENYFLPTKAFDTGRPENPYPSISGEFVGTIRTNKKIIAKKLYTYACEGTGGHTEYALICNSTWCAYAEWEGYKGDWMNLSFNRTVVLMPYETYNITIVTGSYPQIHHTSALQTENGWINCTEFTDANGKKYENWIPAIKLWS